MSYQKGYKTPKVVLRVTFDADGVQIAAIPQNADVEDRTSVRNDFVQFQNDDLLEVIKTNVYYTTMSAREKSSSKTRYLFLYNIYLILSLIIYIYFYFLNNIN